MKQAKRIFTLLLSLCLVLSRLWYTSARRGSGWPRAVLNRPTTIFSVTRESGPSPPSRVSAARVFRQAVSKGRIALGFQHAPGPASRLDIGPGQGA